MTLEEIMKAVEGKSWIIIVPEPLEYPKVRINIHTNIMPQGEMSQHEMVIALMNYALQITREKLKSERIRHELESSDRPVEASEKADKDSGGESGASSGPGA